MGSSTSSGDHPSNEKRDGGDDKHVTVQATDVDVAAQLTAGLGNVQLDSEVARKLKRKIDWHLMPLMCCNMTFADKTTLGQSAVMGILDGAHLTQNQYNWLGTVFYLSLLVFEWPQNYLLQRLPAGKWMSLNIFAWAVVLLCHAACHSFGALFAVRLLLGIFEGAITPGFMIVTSMFYTRAEQTRRVGTWFLMNGGAIIFLGFIAFGLEHTNTSFMPWQWLMVITGLLTLIISVLFWFFFPDSPVTAWFLTPEERVLAVERIKSNQAGVENKTWKKEQFLEALTDHKVWLIAIFTGLINVFNSLTNQRQIIVSEFGFSDIVTTLIGCVDGVVEIVAILVAITLASFKPIGRVYSCLIMFVPALIGEILVETLPSHNKIGLLFTYWCSICAITPFAITLGMVGSLIAGHTKRSTTANAIVLIFYGIGNASGPFASLCYYLRSPCLIAFFQMWKKKYQPRNHVPWTVMAACTLAAGAILLLLRILLVRENARRDRLQQQVAPSLDNVYIMATEADGTVQEKKIDKEFLDLTDKQNLDFRYVL
ncbi:MFS general substrate transporter [Fistulina hepatica ATCC 64428]|nr:MFS general substrate transporter [Fistulina hepatica ATCC 64428]